MVYLVKLLIEKKDGHIRLTAMPGHPGTTKHESPARANTLGR